MSATIEMDALLNPDGEAETPTKGRKASKTPGVKRGADVTPNWGVPKVDLLPQEVRDQAAVKKVRSRAIVGILCAAALVAVASGVAFYGSVSAAASLVAAQAQTSSLLLEQAKYAEVNQVKQDTAAVQDAQQIGSWTEIEWRSYLQQVQGTVPAGMTITNIVVDSASATEPYAQASVPLQGPRVATLTFTASSEGIPMVPLWLDSLTKLPGFVDATPTSIEAAEKGYTVNMTMHVGDAAFSGRFAEKDAAAETDAAADPDAAADDAEAPAEGSAQ